MTAKQSLHSVLSEPGVAWHRALWILVSALALVASVPGILNPGVYDGVVARFLIPGAFAQDVISAIVALGLLGSAIGGGARSPKFDLVALGLLGYLFYAYGIYVIERTYNGFYLVYLAIFTLSFWGIVFACTRIRDEVLEHAQLADRVRVVSALGALLQPIIFYPLWISMLLPLMVQGDQIDSLYSIFILDLCFIMPAFLVLAFLMFRRRGSGLVLAPPVYILGFTLIFSLALAELVKPRFGEQPDVPAFLAAAALSLLFLVLGSVHLLKLRVAPVSLNVDDRTHSSLRDKRTSGRR
ncbi:hypothetical protein [Mycetocola miduiensis]|uniref:Uncharacterized protein n=1 Tax=Mycetocola miduiensis TaxID=995034 RepID=A0A1I5CVD2_9MICO|nr:hypothetical protein [Mycetocola miduiensis]SFN90945.1 hypothetical protein SAMN05216219_2603 [Mycetocola miduiensis]